MYVCVNLGSVYEGKMWFCVWITLLNLTISNYIYFLADIMISFFFMAG